jgi:hypothetical protein
METEIIVDGKKIDINPFVKSVTYEINAGLLKSLHHVPEWTKVEIVLKK